MSSKSAPTNRGHDILAIDKTADDKVEILTTYGRFILEPAKDTPLSHTKLSYLVDELKGAIRG